jgi:hypothetical protein
VAVEVRATPLANKIIEELPRRSRRAYDLDGTERITRQALESIDVDIAAETAGRPAGHTK